MKNYLLVLLSLSSILVSCKKGPNDLEDPKVTETSKLAPEGFNFETTKKVNVSIRLLSNISEPLKGVIVDVNSTSGETLLRGVTDAEGFFKSSVNLPAYLDTLVINPNNTGLTKNVYGLISNKSLTCVIGGSEGVSGDIATAIASNKIYTSKAVTLQGNSVFNITYSPMGNWDPFGRPNNYRDPVKGTVSANLITYIGESLPEQQNVAVHHPSYISDNATQHLNITKTSDVWITFVSEGAFFTNTVGWYVYNTNNPPNNVNQIGDVKILFPNASGAGSSGTMQSGDRVKLGTFTAGKSIGFVLLQNAWKQNLNTYATNGTKFFSDSRFNPEGTNALKRHTVLLNFAQENLFVIGFEDTRRDAQAVDNDFNDLILYATSTPVDAISTVGVEGMQPPKDTDGDGVWDVNDKFPNDATKAYITYFPSANTQGTLVFEDNWPSKGDYDMNDLVVNYKYTYISNSNNKVVQMKASYNAVAAWAFNENGFGVQLPVASNLVSSVTGHKLSSNYINLNTNGTEAGQSKAVIIAFDNHKNLLFGPTGVIDSAVLTINFTAPVDWATIGTAPYNPFLICNKQRGVEAHLPGYVPTDKADLTLLGTGHDWSRPAQNKYYLSELNWPWALHFTETFRYPKEGNAIDLSYLKFGQWASSGGTVFTDWYKNTSPGYRNELLLQ